MVELVANVYHYLVDTFPLLPSFLHADFIVQLRQFYVNTYNDKFFQGTPPPWFTAFIWMELLYHFPLSVWAIGALLRGRWWQTIEIALISPLNELIAR